MTNLEAIGVSKLCGILFHFKQINVGLSIILHKNSKVANQINSELEQILTEKSFMNEDDLKLFKTEYFNAQFFGDFLKIHLSDVTNLEHEEKGIFNNKNEPQGKITLKSVICELLEHQIIVE